MLSVDPKKYKLAALSMPVLTFILLFTGVKVFAGMEIGVRNYFAYAVFSLIIGAIVALFIYFKMTAAFLCFMAGYVTGFCLMYRAFIYDSSGWGDLAGIISLLFWIAIGLGAGLLLQLAIYLFRKIKKQ